MKKGPAHHRQAQGQNLPDILMDIKHATAATVYFVVIESRYPHPLTGPHHCFDRLEDAQDWRREFAPDWEIWQVTEKIVAASEAAR
jgi:hypothetical protein